MSSSFDYWDFVKNSQNSGQCASFRRLAASPLNKVAVLLFGNKFAQLVMFYVFIFFLMCDNSYAMEYKSKFLISAGTLIKLVTLALSSTDFEAIRFATFYMWLPTIRMQSFSVLGTACFQEFLGMLCPDAFKIQSRQIHLYHARLSKYLLLEPLHEECKERVCPIENYPRGVVQCLTLSCPTSSNRTYKCELDLDVASRFLSSTWLKVEWNFWVVPKCCI